jgi:hypothetical protein
MTEEQSYFVASGDSHALKDDARASSRVERQDIDWAKTDIPEYAGAYAVVLDNVLAPAECAELVREAQARAASASGNGTGTGGDAWHGALLNGDVLDLATRKCLRIIWDSPQVVERLWRRIADSVPELQRVDAGSPVIMWGRGDTAHRMTRCARAKKKKIFFIFSLRASNKEPYCTPLAKKPKGKMGGEAWERFEKEKKGRKGSLPWGTVVS